QPEGRRECRRNEGLRGGEDKAVAEPRVGKRVTNGSEREGALGRERLPEQREERPDDKGHDQQQRQQRPPSGTLAQGVRPPRARHGAPEGGAWGEDALAHAPHGATTSLRRPASTCRRPPRTRAPASIAVSRGNGTWGRRGRGRRTATRGRPRCRQWRAAARPR